MQPSALAHDERLVARCFLLDHGKYFRNGNLHVDFRIFGRFIDANGQSALTRKRCLSIGDRRHLNTEKTLGIHLEPRVGVMPRGLPGHIGLWNGFHISTAKLRYQLEIDVAEVDLQRAAHFVAVAGMAEQAEMVVGLISRPGQERDPCGLVDDAARLRMVLNGAVSISSKTTN